MWTRGLLKQNGMIAFRRNYWTCVAVSALAMLLGGGMAGGGEFNFNFENTANSGRMDATYGGDVFSSGGTGYADLIPIYFLTILGIAVIIAVVVGLCIAILVSNVAMVGCNRYFLENREHKTSIGQLFYAFQDGRYSTTVWVMFLRTLYVFGWSLLFIVPGIVKSYSYMLVPYILAEDTYMDKSRVFELSSQMMRGHKWEAFVLNLSFMGWYLLGAVTAGIVNIFYVNPYVNATYAEFYSAIKAEALQKGIIMEGELPGVGTQEA